MTYNVMPHIFKVFIRNGKLHNNKSGMKRVNSRNFFYLEVNNV